MSVIERKNHYSTGPLNPGRKFETRVYCLIGETNLKKSFGVHFYKLDELIEVK